MLDGISCCFRTERRHCCLPPVSEPRPISTVPSAAATCMTALHQQPADLQQEAPGCSLSLGRWINVTTHCAKSCRKSADAEHMLCSHQACSIWVGNAGGGGGQEQLAKAFDTTTHPLMHAGKQAAVNSKSAERPIIKKAHGKCIAQGASFSDWSCTCSLATSFGSTTRVLAKRMLKYNGTPW